jgi:ssDNA-binding replication factor A large subunit
MDGDVRDHYEKVEDLFSEEEFLEAVDEVVDRSGGLLHADVAALRVVDEAGRNDDAVVGLADLEGRAEATVLARIEEVGDASRFDNDGGGGTVRNVPIYDADGRARLVLWDDDVEEADDLAAGDAVRVVNARVKHTSYGLELHMGRWSEVEVVPEGEVDDLPAEVPDGAGDPIQAGDDPSRPVTPLGDVNAGDEALRVQGEVVRVEPTKTFRRDDGTQGFIAKAHLRDESGTALLTAWDDHVRTLQDFDVGDPLEATGLRAKEYRGDVELHTSRGTNLETPDDGNV